MLSVLQVSGLQLLYLQAVRQLQQAAATADAATAAYQTLRIQGGTALLEARNELNTADTAFNQAKTQAYKELNLAQQTYKETLKA
jgi:predicted lipoprotein